MAEKKIKVKVDVETNVEPSLAQLRELKKQLKETAAGSAEFIRLQQQIDDVQDSLVAARAGAGNFADVLGQLPGPIGQIGGQLGGTITTLKQFSSLKISNIQASFVELGKDIGDIASGFMELTGITKVYTVVNNALSKSFIALGASEAAAAAGAKALSAALVATGIGALVVLLGVAASALYEMASGEKAAAAAAEQLNSALETQNELLDLNEKAAKNRQRVTIARMRAQGATEAEIRKETLDNAYSDYSRAFEAQEQATKLYNDNIGKADKDGLAKLEKNLADRTQAAKDAYASYLELGYNQKAEELKNEESKNKELAGKRKQKSDKEVAERKAELETLKKGLEDARLATLDERNREEAVVNDKYDKLKALAIKYKQDVSVVEQARAKELGDIADKAAKEELEKKQKQNDDALALEETTLSLRLEKGELKEKEYNQALFDLRKNAAIQSETLSNETFAKEQSNLKAAYDSGKLSLEEFNAKKAELENTALAKNKEYISAQIELQKGLNEEKKQLAEDDRNIQLTKIQQELDDLDRANKQSELDFAQDLERLAQQKQLLSEQEVIDLQNEELTEFQRTEIRKKYSDQRKSIAEQEIATEKAAMIAKHEINLQYLGLFQQFGNLLGQVAGKSKGLAIAGVVISQAAAIGQIISQTAIANAKAVAATPLTGGMPFVAINTASAALSIASTIASAVKSIQQINQAAAQGDVTGGKSGGSVATAPNIPAPKVAGAAAPTINTTGGMNPNTQIAETIAGARAPLKAYVISGEVSSQQALDRRTSRAATFTGG
jgi:hypothetical protein